MSIGWVKKRERERERERWREGSREIRMGLKRSGQGAINQAEMIFGYLFLSKWNGDEWLWRLVKILVVMIVHKFPKISSAIYGWWVSFHIFWNGLAIQSIGWTSLPFQPYYSCYSCTPAFSIPI